MIVKTTQQFGHYTGIVENMVRSDQCYFVFSWILSITCYC